LHGIEEKIEEVDDSCTQLAKQIYQYLEERVQRFSEERDERVSKLLAKK
jgi:hypothetical protein